MPAGADLAEHLGQGLLELGCLGRRPHHQRAAGPQHVARGGQERRVVERLVGVVDQVARAVVDVEQDQVVRRRPGLGDRDRDVGQHDNHPLVSQQSGAVRDGAVAHPPHQRLLDLDDGALLHPGVGEHLMHREAEPQAGDHHRSRLLDHRQRRSRQRPLGAHLEGVHHEHAVGAQLQRRRPVVGPALPQHQLPALALRPGDLDVLHGSIVPGRVARPVEGPVSRRSR